MTVVGEKAGGIDPNAPLNAAADNSGFDFAKAGLKAHVARVQDIATTLHDELAQFRRRWSVEDVTEVGRRLGELGQALKILLHEARKGKSADGLAEMVRFQRLLSELDTEVEGWERGIPRDQQTAIAARANQLRNDLSLLLHQTRKANRRQQQELEFDSVKRQSRIRTLCLAEIFPGVERLSVPIGAINELGGHPNKVDLLFVAAIAMYRKARRIFEFGTYTGRTTYHLAQASPEARVFTLNLPPERDPRHARYLATYFEGTEAAAKITQIFADSNEFDTTPFARQMDYIFVDADHSYEGVKNDTEKAFQMLAPGGAVVWHDYAPKSPGVAQFIKELSDSRPLFRVRNTCLIVYLDGVDALAYQPAPFAPCAEFDALTTDSD